MTDIALPSVPRPAFFTGQRLLPETLDEAFAMPLALHRLHNRTLHGYGIGLGLDVTAERGATTATVSAGYAIDANGDDLIVAIPVRVDVPPVSSAPDGSPVPFTLIVSATADADAVVQLRAGVCDTSGAVRRSDAPTVRFVSPELVREGLDVVLAQMKVQNCKLTQRWSPAGRRSILPAARPYVCGGATTAGATGWRAWPDSNSPRGAVTTVSTAAAGFGDTPRYQARVEGDRFENGVLMDGPVSVESTTPTSFDVVVMLPQAFTIDNAKPVNPSQVYAYGYLDDRGWRVVWIGVEG